MKKNGTEIYNLIASAKIGGRVCTRHQNGIEYSQTIEDALKQQGYIIGKDYNRVFEWGTCKTYIEKLSDIKPYQVPKHDIKIGDVFYNSWGYEQTNIDYYQVVSTTEKTISLRRIKSGSVDYDAYQMTGHSVPVADTFKGDEIIRKTPYLLFGEWRVSFEYGAGSKWDGEPMNYTCYA